ncbi:hypothetical protein DFH28DRAFT_451393 [Melampsora americana]|nr:hypothetical protein DFH28DRAFT_451393 [Melampsora americana]
MHGCKKNLQSFVRRHLSNWKRDVSRGYGTVISDKNGKFSLWERWNSQATRIIDFAQQTKHPESNQSLHSSQRYLSLTTSDWDFVPMKRSGKRQTQEFDDLPLLHIREPLQLQKPLSRESAYLYSLQLDYVLDARRHHEGDAMTSAKRLPTFLRLKQSNTDFREVQSLMIHRHKQKANHQKSKPKK